MTRPPTPRGKLQREIAHQVGVLRQTGREIVDLQDRGRPIPDNLRRKLTSAKKIMADRQRQLRELGDA